MAEMTMLQIVAEAGQRHPNVPTAAMACLVRHLNVAMSQQQLPRGEIIKIAKELLATTVPDQQQKEPPK